MFDLLLILEHFFVFYLALPLVLIVSATLTWKLKFLQFRTIGLGLRSLFAKEKAAQGSISNFEAISTVLAGNLGTGNISGMAIALQYGGPSSIIWMWIFTFLTMIAKYGGCLLAIEYRKETKDHRFFGGPMYYMSEGVGSSTLALLFSLAAVLTSFTVGNWTQIHSLLSPVLHYDLSPQLLSFLFMVMVACVILGGVEKIAKVASKIVPLMAICYLSASLAILFFHQDHLPAAFELIFTQFFSPSSFLHGSLGFGISQVIRSSLERAIFATDAGVGIAPILQASARTSHPAKEGIVAMVAPLVVMVICTATILVLITTGSMDLLPYVQGTSLCMLAFERGLGSHIGSMIVLISLFFFAFTTVLAWWCCLERVVTYLLGEKFILLFKLLFLAVIPLAPFFELAAVWLIADIAISMMLITNLIALFYMRETIINSTKRYFRKHLVSEFEV